jgi:hypothetical protein
LRCTPHAVRGDDGEMSLPRTVTLPPAAAAALLEVLGILGDNRATDDPGHLFDLAARIHEVWPEEELVTQEGPDRDVVLHVEDAELLIGGLAYTEVMSADLPWIDMVRWSVGFVAAELRGHWSDDEWRARAGA